MRGANRGGSTPPRFHVRTPTGAANIMTFFTCPPTPGIPEMATIDGLG